MIVVVLFFLVVGKTRVEGTEEGEGKEKKVQDSYRANESKEKR